MSFTLEEVQALRHELYHLTPDALAADRFRYEDLRALYISKAEGCVPYAYKDVLGLTTVGIGFNMDRKESRMEWALAFGAKIDFDAVYYGQLPLTQEEMTSLFRSGLAFREDALKHSYANVWSALRPNERLATESAYYNGECLVQGPNRNTQQKIVPDQDTWNTTRYYTHLERYTFTKNVEDLKLAVVELRDRSNKRNIHGLELRRASEAELLSSFKVDGFLAAA